MAIKAKAEITISRIIDIENVIRYYLLQSSSIAAPSKPTANPPGGSWSTTEPTYNSGATNSLYFTDLTIMSNGTYSYSAVSKSSSYEAAKEAWNKANNAQDGVGRLTTRVESAETSISKNNEEIALRAKKTEVTEAINNIDIGGRNLARKTSNEWGRWYSPLNKNNCVEIISLIYPGPRSVGDVFMLSFDIDVKKFTGSGDGPFALYLHGDVDGSWGYGNPFTNYNFATKALAGDYTEHVSYTCKIANTYQAKAVCFQLLYRCDYSDGTGKFRIRNLKVEKGNKATDWTPAPEDYYTKTETDASIQVLSDKISQQVSTTDKLGTRLSKVEQDSSSWSVTLETANAAKNAADNASQTASSASSTASAAKLTADNANKTASSAVSTASNAQKTAENAVSTASSASSAATEAKNTADAANKTASNANSTASEAKKTADSANTTAGQAKSTADNASQTASSAKSAADKANENASSAVSTANTAKSTADTAKSTADTARQEASDAAKTATNFMGFDSNGLVVGDRTANTLGKNVLIGADSVIIRNGSTVLAEFADDIIAIGKGHLSQNATIDFLNGTFQIASETYGGRAVTNLLSDQSIQLGVKSDIDIDGPDEFIDIPSAIEMDTDSINMRVNDAGSVLLSNDAKDKSSRLVATVYGQSALDPCFTMSADRSSGYNKAQVDTGNGVYTTWQCNGGGTADITHSVKSTNSSTKVAQLDSSIRFAKNSKLVASYDGTTPVLLSTAVYPNADYTGIFSAPASTQPHGILIEFAPYADGQVKGYGLVTFFIPKGRCNGESYNIYIDPWCSKWIYVYDNKIVGNDANSKNGTTNGISYNNRKYVLSRVYGV